MNRSFWTAASSSGFVINSPVSNFTQHNTAETLFDRLEAHGRTWKVYVEEPMPLSFAGLIHMPRLKDRLATKFAPYSEFEQDAARGTLPDFSLIEPNMLSGHSDYHPAFGRSLIPGDMDIPMDPPSSIRGGWPSVGRRRGARRSTGARSCPAGPAVRATCSSGWALRRWPRARGGGVVRVATLASTLGKGLVAGFAGTAAMTASSTVEQHV
jgi:phospholipase C